MNARKIRVTAAAKGEFLLAATADDFDALEKLRRLAFSDKVDEPQQLSLFAEEAA